MGNRNTVAVRVDAKVVTIPTVQDILMHDVKRSYVRIKNAVVCVA